MTLEYHTATTLNEIRNCYPCKSGWKVLLRHLGKTKADDEPLELLTILESNGLDDAIWCLQAPSLGRLSRHFQAWCAEQVLHILEEGRPYEAFVRNKIAMLRNDDVTEIERYDARKSAERVAYSAVLSVEWSAAKTVASTTARGAAQHAVWAVEEAEARAAERGVRWRWKLWGSALEAAKTEARVKARMAARVEARTTQEVQLRKMIGGIWQPKETYEELNSNIKGEK